VNILKFKNKNKKISRTNVFEGFFSDTDQIFNKTKA